MAEFICNTSPLQYLHQLDLLHLLPALMQRIIVPTAVAQEIEAGQKSGIDLPDLSALDWIQIKQPQAANIANLVTDLGAGETEVLVLAFEFANPIVILDDALARRTAERLNLKIIGTLGILINAKNNNLIGNIKPILDRLNVLRFRLSAQTRRAVLELAGE